MARRKPLSTEGKTWARRNEVMNKTPRISEDTIAAVLAEETFLHLDGIGYEAFGHVPSSERLEAMTQSRQKLLTGSEDALREACKFLAILGVQNTMTVNSPSAFWLVHLYQALAKNGGWNPPEVPPGIIICAAKLLRIKVSASVYLRPDARICLSTDKCAKLHRFCLRTNLYKHPMHDAPLGKPRGPRKKKILLPEEGDISHMKNEFRAAYDRKGNGVNTIVPAEDFAKFNVPEVQDDDEIIEA